MPKIDANTGVPVMTFGEFIASQAKHEGISPQEIMEDIHNSLEEDSVLIKNEFYDASTMKHNINQYLGMYSKDIEDRSPWFVNKINNIWGFSGGQGIRSGGGSAFFFVTCSDDKFRILGYSFNQSSGDYFNPPDYEEEVKEFFSVDMEELDGNSNPLPEILRRCRKELIVREYAWFIDYIIPSGMVICHCRKCGASYPSRHPEVLAELNKGYRAVRNRACNTCTKRFRKNFTISAVNRDNEEN